MAQWGIAMSRWGNPFASGVRPAALLQQGRDAVDSASRDGTRRPSASAPTSTRSRGSIDTAIDGSADAGQGVSRRDGEARGHVSD